MVQGGGNKNAAGRSKKAKKYLAPTKSRAQAPMKAKKSAQTKVTAAIGRNIEAQMAARASLHGAKLRLVKAPKDLQAWAKGGLKVGSKSDHVRDTKNLKLRAQRNNSIPPPPGAKKQ